MKQFLATTYRRTVLILLGTSILAMMPAPAQAATPPKALPCIPPLCVPGVGDILEPFKNSALAFFAEEFGAGVVWFFSLVLGLGTKLTKVELEAAWYDAEYMRVYSYAIVLSLVFSLLALYQSLGQRDAGAGFMRFLKDLTIFAIGSVALRPLVTLVMRVVDEGTLYLASDMDTNTKEAAEKLALWTFKGEIPAFAILFLAFFGLLSLGIIIFELFIREAAIYLLVLYMPLYFAARIWPVCDNIFKTAMKLLAAVIVAKLFLIPTVSLGMAMLAGLPDSPGKDPVGMARMLPALGFLLLAGLMPLLLLKVLGAANQIHGSFGSIRQDTRIVTQPVNKSLHAVTTFARGGASHASGNIKSSSSGSTAAQPGVHSSSSHTNGSTPQAAGTQSNQPNQPQSPQAPAPQAPPAQPATPPPPQNPAANPPPPSSKPPSPPDK